MIGRSLYRSYDGGLEEETRWIGKPWRRIELLTQRHFCKGETVATERTLTLHVGSRTLGLGLTLIIDADDCLTYSDEEHQ